MHFIKNENIIVENLFGNIDMNEININEKTKTIRDYEYALNYKNQIMTIFFYMLLPIIPTLVFMILEIFGIYKDKNGISTGLSISFLAVILMGVISYLLKLGFSEKGMKFINKKIYKIDNQYADFLLDAAYRYDERNKTYQLRISDLKKHISSPYFTQEMLEDVIKFDKNTMLLIDIDIQRSEYYHISQACFEVIQSELSKLVVKFEKIESQYKQQKDEENQQIKENLLQFLKNYESKENEHL